MENASKALIIAGSILIAILIISLGIVIFNNMKGYVEENADLDEQEVASFNAQITPYIGNSISGSQVNALIQTVRSINQKAINEGTSKAISITYPVEDSTGTTSEVTLASDNTGATSYKVATGGKYYTVVAYYASNGLISSITVTNAS